MKTRIITVENSESFLRIFERDKIERVNPILYFIESIRDMLIINNEDEVLFKYGIEGLVKFKETINKIATDESLNLFKEIKSKIPHQNFISLLSNKKKSSQIKLLKNMKISSFELHSLFFISYEEFGYLYSSYLFETIPNGIEINKLPIAAHINEDGNLDIIGETDISNNEIKRIISHKKTFISHFIEKEDIWHCFFGEYDGIYGKEKWNSGTPHLHYISSSFNINKEDFIESMKKGNYKSSSIHIELT
jgi:hypothetical protein